MPLMPWATMSKAVRSLLGPLAPKPVIVQAMIRGLTSASFA